MSKPQVESGEPKCPHCGGNILQKIFTEQYYHINELKRAKSVNGWGVSVDLGDLEDTYDSDNSAEYVCEDCDARMPVEDLKLVCVGESGSDTGVFSGLLPARDLTDDEQAALDILMPEEE